MKPDTLALQKYSLIIKMMKVAFHYSKKLTKSKAKFETNTSNKKKNQLKYK